MVQFEGKELPNHGGWFEIRIHKNNDYGDAVGVFKFNVWEAPISNYKKYIFLSIMLFLTWLSQVILNNKGICTFMDPEKNSDAIQDYLVGFTVPFNKYLIDNSAIAEFLQALSSFFLDIGKK